MSALLSTAIKEQVRDRDLTPDNTLISLLAANGVEKPGKLRRSELEDRSLEIILEDTDLSGFIPQVKPLTAQILEDVIDPVTSVIVPTGRYRVTMRKLLRLSLTQLQQQAEEMKLDILNLDEEGIASLIIINLNEESEIIEPLAKLLLAKEVATVFGIRFQVPIRGPSHPSSTVSFILRPNDMINSLELTKSDLLEECRNQAVSTSINVKEDKKQLATRLVVWWTAHPNEIREPFTENFSRFLLEMAKLRGV